MLGDQDPVQLSRSLQLIQQHGLQPGKGLGRHWTGGYGKSRQQWDHLHAFILTGLYEAAHLGFGMAMGIDHLDAGRQRNQWAVTKLLDAGQ